MSDTYDHQALANKWSKKWLEDKYYQPDLKSAAKPFYNLMMFPYPSAEGLHVGNMYAFTGADVYGRYKRMKGFDVFEPIGLDGFGIHSENYALKIGKHPREQARVSEQRFYEQLSKIGDGFAWDYRLETYDQTYYSWTQWLFVQMFKHGLAYRKSARVNWCPSCKTVLADEQVEDGKCERCGTVTTFKELNQWFFTITDYADRLLEDIDELEWPEKIKIAQRQWIGRSKGLLINFKLQDSGFRNNEIGVWTKFWETVFGTTFVVVAPEHPVVSEILNSKVKIQKSKLDEIREYVEKARAKTEQQRKAEDKDKSGVDTGLKVINPVNGASVPLWVADYVLTNVGTGAVMGVPMHDERDFAFVEKYGLPKIQVVTYEDVEVNEKVAQGEQAHEGEGRLVNSGQFDGMDAWGEGKKKMAEWMIREGYASWHEHYHLRDWLISRQRYWGPPIPMVYCEACAKQGKSGLAAGEHSVEWDHAGWYAAEGLPVTLPDLQDWKPKGDGRGPLENASDDWLYTTCPGCGGARAKRETDVSDTFLDSSWYFLAYPNLKTEEWKSQGGENAQKSGPVEVPWDAEVVKKWLPVNAYIGGAEHAVLHLLYSRFVWKALCDWGYLPFTARKGSEKGKEEGTFKPEPFPYLFGHGLIIKDGSKMSKSRGNVVNPDEYIEQYGADALRLYLMFLGPFSQGGDFRDSGMQGMRRFLDRVWRMMTDGHYEGTSTPKELASLLHETVAKVDADMANFRFNTAIAKIMEFVNAWKESGPIQRHDMQLVVKMLSPLAPYIAEELWSRLGTEGQEHPSVHYQHYPQSDDKAIAAKELVVMVQIDGKVRSMLTFEPGTLLPAAELMASAAKDEKAAKWLEGKEVVKTVFVPPTPKRQGMLSLVTKK